MEQTRGTSHPLLAGAWEGRGPSYLRPVLYLVSLAVLLVLGVGMIGTPLLLFVICGDGRCTDLSSAELSSEMVRTLSTTFPGLLLNLLQFLIILGYTWLWVRAVERRPFSSLGLRGSQRARRWARGILIGAGYFGLSLVLLSLGGGLRWVGFAPAGLASTVSWLIAGFLFFLIQGPAEEILARGYLLQTWGARGGVWVGVALSSIVFASGHVLNPDFNPIALLNLVLFGVVMALYALHEGSLWGVFGLHTSWNWFQGNVLGLPVSGVHFGNAPLMDLDTAGATWWSGGSFGPEGGLAVTLATVLFILALFLAGRRPASPAA